MRLTTLLSFYFLLTSFYSLVARNLVNKFPLRFSEKKLREFTELAAGASYDQITQKASQRLTNQDAESQMTAMFQKGSMVGRLVNLHLSLTESLTLVEVPFGGQMSLPLTMTLPMRIFVINGKLSASHASSRQIHSIDAASGGLLKPGSVVEAERGTIVLLHYYGDILPSHILDYFTSVFDASNISGSIIFLLKLTMSLFMELAGDARRMFVHLTEAASK